MTTLNIPNPTRTDPRLDAIRGKVLSGDRLTLEDGDLLYTTPDIWTVCELADAIRRRLHGEAAYYNINRHLNYSNVCALSCKFCEFYRKKDDEGAYTRDMDYVREEVRKAVEGGATEIHSVGGLHPYLHRFDPDDSRDSARAWLGTARQGVHGGGDRASGEDRQGVQGG
jgi:aminodeoxyfutalosine synthase